MSEPYTKGEEDLTVNEMVGVVALFVLGAFAGWSLAPLRWHWWEMNGSLLPDGASVWQAALLGVGLIAGLGMFGLALLVMAMAIVAVVRLLTVTLMKPWEWASRRRSQSAKAPMGIKKIIGCGVAFALGVTTMAVTVDWVRSEPESLPIESLPMPGLGLALLILATLGVVVTGLVARALWFLARALSFAVRQLRLIMGRRKWRRAIRR